MGTVSRRISSLSLFVWLTIGAACSDIEVPPDPCVTYCEEVQRSCGVIDPENPGPGQYITLEACKIYCKGTSGMALGEEGDEAVDTISCRTYHAGLAALDPETHCPHAGPTGGDVCGSYCEVYCGLMTNNCSEQFSDSQACQDACAAFPTSGATGDITGDTVQCRINFAGLAGLERGGVDSQANCELAMPASGACGVPPTCDALCEEVVDACVDGNAYYANVDDCVDVCARAQAWPAGTSVDTNVSTIGCRLASAVSAAAAADSGTLEQLCRNASETGGGICGGYCDVYCDVLARNCDATLQADFQGELDSCRSACGSFATTGAPAALSGDTVQCRIAYATAAGMPENAGSEDALCASAQVSSVACQ